MRISQLRSPAPQFWLGLRLVTPMNSPIPTTSSWAAASTANKYRRGTRER